jgi:outer membrane protein insertion porin family
MRFAAIFVFLLVFAGTGNGQTQKRTVRKTTSASAPAVTAVPAEGAPFPVQTLAVVGNHNYTARQILSVAAIRVGQNAGKADFEAARDRLIATGVFDTVGYHFAPAKDGKGYDASFEVVEIAQVYPLHFEDLPVPDTQIRAWLQQKDPLFGPKIPATKLSLDRYVAWISEFLAQHEYREPIIARVVSENPPDLSILFRPAKLRPAIAHVKFTGTGVLPVGMLQTAMHGVAIGVSYTEAQYRLLLDTTIRPLYEARGMIRISFGKVETEPAKDVEGVVVSAEVNPGPVYKLGKVSFKGADSAARESFDKLAALKADQTVSLKA